jgi:DNA-binding CsgD family transcriptional regulator
LIERSEFCVWVVSPPISEEDATKLLRHDVPNFDARMSAGQIEILQGYEWYLKGNEFDPKLITAGWSEKLDDALARGYEGMRVSGNAFWFETNLWKEFCEYEQELDRALAGNLITSAERALLAHLVIGATSKEAARALGISPKTVDFHRASMMKKLGAKNIVELVRKVMSEML